MSAPDTIDTKAELKSLTRDEARLLRLLLLVPEQQERVAATLAAQGARLPSTPARELLTAMLVDRDVDRDAGGMGDFKRMRFLEALPPELHSLAIALYADRGPNDPTTLDTDHVRNGVDQCLLALEADRLEDEIRFNAGELMEAQAAVDPQTIARLLEAQRSLYEARNSLDRRREAVSNLTTAGGHR
jgi:hypothetical protein